ncbi:hypothetical protein CDAR_50101 [Caerostris darwini]|uniref:Uncharacterized protein n=2 Tax=Caerostris darwini TaxID=1538125 RepID=A0AAV4UY39_9ARAC|nr:hypothetical protein CDAR_50101 [Caerostris darwini]
MKTKFFRFTFRTKKKATWAWQRWDSNPRLLRDWCLKNQRLRPLGHATDVLFSRFKMKTKFFRFTFRTKKRSHSGMAAVGFEPTPPQRLVPKTSALDHSATLPTSCFLGLK